MTSPIVIIGAGWAGLAAAVTLSRHNIPVHVYESAQQLGGRARSVHTAGMEVDNGQHLMIGAYREMLQLLQHMQADEAELFLRIPQHLQLLQYPSGDRGFQLTLPRLPAPLHLLLGMLRCPSLNIKQKLQTLLRFNRLLNSPLAQDLPVSDWLATAGLPQIYVDRVLSPLCLAALTTHPQQASARAFQAVLVQTFNGPRANTDLLIAKKNLGQVFPQLARQYIESRGGKVFTGQRLQQIDTDGHRVSAITVADQRLQVEQLILATPPTTTHKLLSPVTACAAIAQQLEQLTFETITTVYLQYAPQFRLEVPMIGLLNATVEWLFDRRVCQQPGLIAAVISASGPHDDMSNTQLGAQVATELQQLFDWPQPEQTRVIREKRATLRCSPNVDNCRPATQTPLHNLRLCGDYVYIEENNQPGLPSTLEGALRSGVKCANELVKELH